MDKRLPRLSTYTENMTTNEGVAVELHEGMMVYIEGDAAEITTSDYTCRMATPAQIVDEPREEDDYILVSVDEIDGDHNAWIYVLKTAIRLMETPMN